MAPTASPSHVFVASTAKSRSVSNAGDFRLRRSTLGFTVRRLRGAWSSFSEAGSQFIGRFRICFARIDAHARELASKPSQIRS